MSKVLINGAAREIKDDLNLAALVEDLGLAEVRVAIELNREVVSRANWEKILLADKDVIEIVHFVGGG